MASPDKLRRLCLNAMLLGVALLLSYLEAILPLTLVLPLPGCKLGLANILITLLFVLGAPWDAALVSFTRIAIMGMLFGTVSSFTFSLCGGLLAYAGLWIFARLGQRYFSMIGICVGCAACHNLGQLLAAAFWFGSEVLLGYLPLLLIASLLFGTISGALLHRVFPRFASLYHRYITDTHTLFSPKR